MSTRAAIGTTAFGINWEGVYHHFDGYPSGLGRTLWTLYHGHFQCDLEAMRHTLIDQHRAGWSTIVGADFALAPGFKEFGHPTDSPRTFNPSTMRYEDNPLYENNPRCYCHGDRSEPVRPLMRCTCPDPDSTCEPLFTEWAYLLEDEGLTIYISTPFEDRWVHAVHSFWAWDGPEPESWELLDVVLSYPEALVAHIDLEV